MIDTIKQLASRVFGPQLTVLVIEDDAVQRLWLQRKASLSGVKVLIPDTVDQLMQIIGTPIDLLVLDRHVDNGWRVGKQKALDWYRGQCPIWEHTFDSRPSDAPVERQIVKCAGETPGLFEAIKEWFQQRTSANVAR